MVKCALCRGRVALTKQLCNDCHVFKELMTRFGKDQVIVRHVLPALAVCRVRANANTKKFSSTPTPPSLCTLLLRRARVRAWPQ
jgi:hypothetical protein